MRHSIPGWVQPRRRDADHDCGAAGCTRPAAASAEILARLDAGPAEREMISGLNPPRGCPTGWMPKATLAAPGPYAVPDWFTWFSPVRLAAFKGNT